MNRAVKCRIRPNKKQKEQMEKTFGCCRFLYNRMLNDRMMGDVLGEPVRPRPAMYKKEYPWLSEVDSLALCNVQLDLETAFRNHRDRKGMGYPGYKSKHHSRRSYTTNVVNGNIRTEGKRIRLPKIGMVRIKVHREIPEDWKMKSVTVSKEPSGKYYASLLFEVPERESQAEGKREEKRCLGIDYAMDGLAVFSDGSRAAYPKYYRRAEERLAREQRKLSHCEKGSRNYARQKRKVAICHEKVRNQRKDFLHKLSRDLADRYDVIGVEDIDMKAMARSLLPRSFMRKFARSREKKMKWVASNHPFSFVQKPLFKSLQFGADALNIRTGAGTNKSILVTIPKGTKVSMYGYYTTVSGVNWYYVQFTYNKILYTGFCSSKYLKK